MSLTPGSRLGTYEILALLGAGGMGEVYRARDTRLKRDVAIKVLPDAFASDPDRLARFQREAELLATLNHPNIGSVYGFEQSDTASAMVLELIEGETLADRIKRGPIPVKAALAIVLQIAEALEAAHERGVIHRDLKPANIKITPDDKVKVLDFGLAKAMGAGSETQNPAYISHSPTLSMLGTQAGMILGTAAYMSPEQAKGLPADQRSDVFAFGVVLYEMLTGRQPFHGDTAPDVLASVIVRDADLNTLPANLNPRLRELIERCLDKNPKKRWQAIGDVRAEVEKLALAPYTAESATRSAAASRWRLAGVGLAIAFVSATVAAAVTWFSRPPPPGEISRLAVLVDRPLSMTGRRAITISPDGRHLAWVADQRIYLRALAGFEASPITGTNSPQGVVDPIFSPDGKHIAFWTPHDRTLKRVGVAGGTPVTICSVPTGPVGTSWSGDFIYFSAAQSSPRGIYRVVASGGTPELIIPAKPDEMMQGPSLLADGKSILFTSASTAASGDIWDTAKIVVQSPGSNERKILVEGGSDARYVSSGHLLYSAHGSIFAAGFDLDRLALTTPAASIVGNVERTATFGVAQFSVSDTGTLSYVSGVLERSGSLIYRNRDGSSARAVSGSASLYPRYPRVSPTGDRLAVTFGPGQNGDIWVLDLRGNQRPLKLTAQGHDVMPAWTPDGRRIVFRSGRPDGSRLWSIASDGSDESQATPVPLSIKVAESVGTISPLDFAPDGRLLLLVPQPSSRGDLFLTSLNVAAPDTKPWLSTDHAESAGRFSPDRRFVAYVSDPTGENEIWIRPFAGPGAPVRVSNGGGREPVWSHDGRELFFQRGAKLMAVRIVQTTPVIQLADETELFSGGFVPFQSTIPRTYDVMPDGRFVMIQLDGGADARQDIAVVLNWFEELKRRVPTRD